MATQFLEIMQTETMATIAFNRPDKRNAMHGPLVQEFLTALAALARVATLRVLVIKGNGDNFCAGGDIGWMQKIATASEDENYADAQLLADLLFQLYSFPVPTIALTHGAVLGGGMGVVSTCDMVLATPDTQFGLPEVKIGVTPSMISPYVIAALGQRAAHYYFLTGSRFDAEEAYRLGFIHQVVAKEEMATKSERLIQQILQNGPLALRAAKQLIRKVAAAEINEALAQKTAEHLAALRATPEAQEGLRAFLEKRQPGWVVTH